MSKRFRELSHKLTEAQAVVEEENKPTNPELWARAKSMAKKKFDVYPSAYANGWASKWYKSKGGGWKTVSEAKAHDEYDGEADMAKNQLRRIIDHAKQLHDRLKDNENMPEWVQNKITKAEDYVSTSNDYMKSEMQEETISESLGDHEGLVKRANAINTKGKGTHRVDHQDKKDFKTAADMIKKGHHSALSKHLKSMDTFPRDIVLQHHVDKKHWHKLGFQSHNEEVEHLTELSPKTLGSYVKKASKDASDHSFDHGDDEHRQYGTPGVDPHADKDLEDRERKIQNRQKGVNTATNKLVKKATNEEATYTAVHAKHGKTTVKADSTYGAAKKAASQWNTGKKGTQGIDVHLHTDKPKAYTEAVVRLNPKSFLKVKGPSSAYDAGYAAAKSGKKYGENPHPRGSKEHLDWSKAHNTARANKIHGEEVEKNYRQPGFNNPRKYTDDLKIMGKDYEPRRLDKKEKKVTEAVDLEEGHYEVVYKHPQYKNHRAHVIKAKNEKHAESKFLSYGNPYKIKSVRKVQMKDIDESHALVTSRSDGDYSAKVYSDKEKNQHLATMYHKGDYAGHKYGKTLHKAKLAAKKFLKTHKEEVEQIDELSKKTLGSYTKQAARSYGWNAQGLQLSKTKEGEKRYGDKMSNRMRGISRAVNRLAKEETLDEISKQTAHSYVKKGMSNLTGMAADRALTKDRAERDELNRKIKNRKQGLSHAVNKLAKEDAEIPALMKKPVEEGYYKTQQINKMEDERLAKQKKAPIGFAKAPHPDLLKKAREWDKKHPLPKWQDKTPKGYGPNEEVHPDTYKAQSVYDNAHKAATKKGHSEMEAHKQASAVMKKKHPGFSATRGEGQVYKESAADRMLKLLKQKQSEKNWASNIKVPDYSQVKKKEPIDLSKVNTVKEAYKNAKMKKKQKPETFEAEPELTSDIQLKTGQQ